MAGTPLAAAAIFVIAATSTAQRDVPSANAGATLSGQVVAADTGAPLADVVLSLRPADQVLPRIPPGGPTNIVTAPSAAPSVRPDADGRFQFSGVPPGRYRLAADPGPTAARYLSLRHPDARAEDAAPITLAANQVHEPLLIALPRAAAITGRVVDERGNGMAFVGVTAQEWLPGGRRRTGLGPVAGLAARTDDDGQFRLFGLAPGEYVVAATPPRQGSLWITAGVVTMPGTISPTYYPGTASLAEASRIRVGSGEEHGPIQLTIGAVRVNTIRGTVIAANGQPAPSVSVHLHGESHMPFAPAPTMSLARQTTASDGSFQLSDVPAGAHALSVMHFGEHGAEFAWIPITVSDDVTDIVLRLQPGTAVKGRVVFEGQAPDAVPTMYIRSQPARTGSGSPAGVMPGEDWTFELPNLFGPTYVRPDGPEGWHLKAILREGRDITDQAVEFRENGPAVVVVLTRDAAVVAGTVTTAAGLPADSLVIVMSEDPALWTERASTTKLVPTSTTGRYRIEGLRAGRYLVVATIREEGPGTSLTPEYFELLAKHATPVTLGDRESKSLDLKRVALR